MEGILGGVFEAIGTVLGTILKIVPKALGFIVWILCGIIILPCVFIAGNLYPVWVKWGDEAF